MALADPAPSARRSAWERAVWSVPETRDKETHKMTPEQTKEALIELQQLLYERWRQPKGRPTTKKFRRMVKRFLRWVIDRHPTDRDVLLVTHEEHELDDGQ